MAHGRDKGDRGIPRPLYLPARLASRQVCRIGISDKRLSYDKNGQNVCIEYNNYREQKAGEPAPKAYRHMEPLAAIHQTCLLASLAGRYCSISCRPIFNARGIMGCMRLLPMNA